MLAVTARRVRDPATGDVIAQITEEDITEKTRLAESLATLNEDLEARVRARSAELQRVNEALLDEIARRKSYQRELEERLDFTQGIIDHIPFPIAFRNAEDTFVLCNRAYSGYLRKTPEDVIGLTAQEVLPKESHDGLAELMRKQSESPEEIDFEIQLHTAAKGMVDFLFRRSVFRDGHITVGVDLTRIKDVEKALEAERDFLRVLMDVIPVPVFYKTADGTYIGCNDLWADFIGVPKSEIIGSKVTDVLAGSVLQAAVATDRIVLETNQPGTFPLQVVRYDGEMREVISYKAPFESPTHGRGTIGTMIDVTEQKKTEKDLQNRELIVQEATTATRTGFLVYDNLTRKVEYATETFQYLLGASDEQFERLLDSIDNRFEVMSHAQGTEVQKTVMAAEASGGPFDVSYRVTHGPAKGNTLRIKGYPLPGLGPGGTKRVSFLQDISDTIEMEEKLRQALKLEAVGKLTGGIAHDFNNLLAVVLGNAELLSLRQSYQKDLIDEIAAACHRGADLTRNLLAYARLQPLQAEPIHLGERSRAVEQILKRTLGADVDLSLDFPPDLWTAVADAGQIEDVLLNLALNARDAMPDGGNLAIEISNVSLSDASVRQSASEDQLIGDFVVIAVTDNGAGMTPEVLANATDPFFTTKPEGQGTGLGLSMVFGFAKQSGGNLTIYSEVGQGTTVKLYLPRHVSDQQSADPDREPAETPLGRGEHVVVVEDDPAVRKLVARMLETLGYRATSFEMAQDALDYLRSGASVDVLLSDVVLPGGMRGTRLSEIARAEFPGLRILFMSGYPSEAARKNGFIGSKSVLLNKPIRRDDFAKAIHAALRQGP